MLDPLFRERDEEEPWLLLELEERGHLASAFLEQRVAHGWPLVDGRYLPTLWADDELDEDSLRFPTRSEVGFALCVLEAMARHGSEVAAGRSVELVVRAEMELAAPVKVELVVPPNPGLRFEAADSGDADDDEEDVRPCLMMDAFGDWAFGRRTPRGTVRLARYMASQVAEFHRSYLDEDQHWLDRSVVREFLVLHAPRKVMLADDAEVDAAPAARSLFVDWLESVSHLKRAEARGLRKTIERAVPAFTRRMRDPGVFGMAKSTFEGMRREGVDIHDDDAVQEYIARLNAAEANRAREPAPREPKHDPRERSSHRWRPAPGERPPGPKEPCPCGSGRRYKKCCKPR